MKVHKSITVKLTDEDFERIKMSYKEAKAFMYVDCSERKITYAIDGETTSEGFSWLHELGRWITEIMIQNGDFDNLNSINSGMICGLVDHFDKYTVLSVMRKAIDEYTEKKKSE